MADLPRRPGRLRRAVVRLLVIGIVAYATMSWFAAGILIRSSDRKIEWNDRLRADFAPIDLVAEDGIKLSGSVIEPPGPAKGTVLFFHGVHACRSLDSACEARDRGWRAVAIDFRAHGESGGKFTSFGYFESYDVRAAVRYARERWKNEPLAVWGVSMGAAAIIYAQDVTKDCDAIAIESCYATIDDAYRHRLLMKLPSFLLPFGAGPRWAVERRIDASASEMRPIDYISKIPAERMFIFTGEKDLHAPPEDTRKLAEKAPGVRTWIVPKATHYDLWRTAGTELPNRVYAFFDERLRARR